MTYDPDTGPAMSPTRVKVKTGLEKTRTRGDEGLAEQYDRAGTLAAEHDLGVR